MSIKIDKALSKSYLVEQLEGFEKYALWDTENRTTVDVPAHYEKVTTGGLTVVADGAVTDPSTEIEISSVNPVLDGYTPAVGDMVAYVEATYKTKTINVHRYGKLAPFKTGKKYFIGDAVINNGCLYQATVDVDGTDTEFPESKFSMVGAASLVEVVSTLPDATALASDKIFWLKADQVDPDDPTIVIHKAGIYTFDNTTKTYDLYREYEDKDIETKSFFETVEEEDLGYVGDADKVVNSLYLHKTLKGLTETIQEEINDIADIMDDVNYIILADKAALDAYDLSTLVDNSMNIFLVKQDDTIDKYEEIANPGTYITVEEYAALEESQKALYKAVYKYVADATTDPITFESTLYACVAFDSDEYPKTTRKAEFVGKLAYGESGLDALIDEKLHDALYTKVSVTGYHKSTDADALTVVADGTKDTQIELASVTPLVSGTTVAEGSIVEKTTAYQTGTTITVVADGTTPLGENELEVSTVNAKLVDGQTAFSAGDTVDGVDAYETSASGLIVVADGLKATEIELASVTPCIAGFVPQVGDKVKNSAVDVEVYKFVLRSEIDVETLGKLGTASVVYTDPNGIEADLTIEYLTFNGTKQMPLDFEVTDIDFTTEYTPIVEG